MQVRDQKNSVKTEATSVNQAHDPDYLLKRETPGNNFVMKATPHKASNNPGLPASAKIRLSVGNCRIPAVACSQRGADYHLFLSSGTQ